jgi:predicted RNA-binding protein (virulence factor B family)
VKIGIRTSLRIDRFTDPGAFLVNDEGEDVLLPNKYLTTEMQLDDVVDVFLYKDSEDRIVATTETPLLELNQMTYLKVVDVNAFGAFVDWGLEKHLLVPFKEQAALMEIDNYYLITLQYDDLTDRLFGSAKVRKYLSLCTDQELVGSKVDILISERTPLGVKVIVNNLYQGMVFRNDISRPLRRGERTIGYVLNVREDGKLDIRLEQVTPAKYDEAVQTLLEKLKLVNVLYLSDKSDPDDIREQVGMSKKTFKQAVGKLYKGRVIQIDETSIRLIED